MGYVFQIGSYSYNNVFVRFGKHSNKHVDHDGDVGNVKETEQQVADAHCQVIVVWADERVFGVADRVECKEKSHTSSAESD